MNPTPTATTQRPVISRARFVAVFNLARAGILCAGLALALLDLANRSRATDFYWSGQSGASDNIDQGANWFNSGANPSSGDNLYFNNTAGARHTPYCNYGAGAYFGFLVSYNGAGGINWRGDQTYLYKFENFNDGSLLRAEATLANRTGPDTDLEINPVGTGGITINNVVMQNGRQLKIYGANMLTVNGNITQSGTGNASLAILQGATVSLNGANTYTGNTTVSSGSLLVNGSLASGSAVSVASNAILGGGGTIGGAITVNSGGILAPGTSIGTLTNNSAPTLNGIILAELNRTNAQTADKLVFNGGATLGGSLIVTNIGPAAQNDDTFDLFDGAVTGGFATLSLPAGGANHWKTNNLVVNGTITFTNASPVASNLVVGVPQGGSATLLVIGGKDSPIDADGDSLTVTAVSAASSGTSGFTSSNVTYLADGSVGTNTFTYTVSDGLGGTDTKTVTAIVGDPQGFNRLAPVGSITNGEFNLSYLGLPGTNYALDWATNLTPPVGWTGLATNQAATNGYLLFSVTNAGAVNFFRTRYVP